MANGYVEGEDFIDLVRNGDSHRTYVIRFNVVGADGPQQASFAAGLPNIGDQWAYFGDNDPWAVCTPEWKIVPVVANENTGRYHVTCTFSTLPIRRCMDTLVEAPFMEPARIRGTFSHSTIEAQYDRHGNVIESSSFERIRGKNVEFDKSTPAVSIELSMLSLPMGEFVPKCDYVNDRPLWGQDARKIKLSDIVWARMVYGKCRFYYTVQYGFDLSDTTFDRTIQDEGTKVLIGTNPGQGGPPAWADVTNRLHFERARDFNQELINHPIPLRNGRAADTGAAGEVQVEYYPEANFLLLGIPASL